MKRLINADLSENERHKIKMVRSPISRVGGKFYLAPKITAMFPEHKRYIEPFGGAMHVLFRKEPAVMEVYNDIDSNLVNFFKCVRCYHEELIKRLDYTLYSRELFEYALVHMDEGADIDRAYYFYIVNRMCFGGKMTSWGITSRGTEGFNEYERSIRRAHERIKSIYIENQDYKRVIARYDSPDSLFYIDPPYIYNAHRGRDRLYRNEMTDADHAELVEVLKGIQGKFILSGYENEFYNCFRRVEMGEVNVSLKKTVGAPRTKKLEYVWMNY